MKKCSMFNVHCSIFNAFSVNLSPKEDNYLVKRCIKEGF
jgi:hypothetical protein